MPFPTSLRAVFRSGPRGFAKLSLRLSPDDVLLLQAALLDGDAAVAAYEAWRPCLQRPTFPEGQQRLLPLLQRNLTRLGIDDPQLERFRGGLRTYGLKNLRSIGLARPVFAALDQRGVPFIVLKGAALIAQYMSDLSLRPMNDIDILVPAERLADAVRVLAEANLAPQDMSRDQFLANGRLQSNLPGWPFVGPNQEIDLHWKLLHLDRRSRADDEFWRACRQASLMGAPIKLLDPAHQLLHICAHAAQPVAGPALQQWPADAAMIIRGNPDLSYDRLVDAADRHMLSAIMADKLVFLVDAFDLPVPRSTIAELRAASGWVERREMRLLAKRTYIFAGVARLLLGFQEFRRGDGSGRSAAESLRAFVGKQTGTKGSRAAGILLLQNVLGRPAWLRGLLGRDRYRELPDPACLPKVGDTLKLAGTEIDEAPLIRGWSWPEVGGRWTVGKGATIGWSLAGSEGDLSLFVDGGVLLHKKAPSQSVELWANDHLVARWRFAVRRASPLPAQVSIPRSKIGKSDVLLLTFAIRSPRSPAELGVSIDARTLGLRLYSVSLTHKDREPTIAFMNPAGGRSPDRPADPHRGQGSELRTLVITEFFPLDPEKYVFGAVLRLKHHLSALAELGPVDVAFFVDDAQLAAAESRVQAVKNHWNISGSVRLIAKGSKREPLDWLTDCFWAARGALGFTGAAASMATSTRNQVGDLKRCLREFQPALLFAHRLGSAAPLLRMGGALPPLIIDLDDVEHIKLERLAATVKRPFAKWRVFARSLLARHAERQIGKLARCLLVSSNLDRDKLAAVCRGARIATAPNSASRFSGSSGVQRASAIFVGTAAYSPNREAILWLAGEIWPLVRRAVPNAQLTIIGERTDRLGVASTELGIVCRGFEADLAPAYAEARLAVCPIRRGAGTRIKIIEAAMNSVPVVSTEIGAEGLAFKSGAEILIADTSASFADACVKLLRSPDFAEEVGRAAQRRAEDLYLPARVAERLRSLCLELVDAPGLPRR